MAVETFENWTHLSPAQKDDLNKYGMHSNSIWNLSQAIHLRSQAQKCKYEGGSVDNILIDQLIKEIAQESV